MAHHRNAGLDEVADRLERRTRALDLDRFGASLFHQPNRGVKCRTGSTMHLSEGYIRREQGVFDAAADAACHEDHLVEGDRNSIGLALDHHRRGIPDEDDVKLGGILDCREAGVIGG